MTNRDIFKAVGNISDELIDAAAPKKHSRAKRVIAPVAALAACLALVLAVWQPWNSPAAVTTDDPATTTQNGVFVPAATPDGVYIPPEPMPGAPGIGMAADMIGFVVHDGRMYTQTGEYATETLLGEYLFTATGSIDEWSGSDEYVEGASSIGGDVYTVKGYDPAFRLCMTGDERGLMILDCLSGITLRTGGDLFFDRLHIDNYDSAFYVTDIDWQHAIDERHELDADIIEPFLATLMTAPMQDWSGWSENGDIFDHDYAEAHICFELKDGTRVNLRLFENGCVMYDGSFMRVLAYMPGAIFDAVFEAST